MKTRASLLFGATLFMAVAQPKSAQALSVAPESLLTPAIAIMPEMYGTKVLYQDFVSGTYRFYTVDIATKTKTEILNNLTHYRWPYDLGNGYGGWISYSGGGGGGGGGGMIGGGGISLPGGSAAYAVSIIDISAKTIRTVTADTSYKDHLALGANGIIWTDYRHSTPSDTFNEVYYAPYSTLANTRISSVSSYKDHLALNGTNLVWQDYRNAGNSITNADIYLFDQGGGGERAICTNAAYQAQPSVSGNIVVWQDYRNAGSNPKNADIFLFDLSSGQERAICTAPGYQGSPQVSGDYVVWQDYRNVTPQDTANADIYLYQISTGTEIALTLRPGYQGAPQLDGTVAVWYDYNDNTLYKGTISNAPSGVVITAARAVAGRAVSQRPLDLAGRRMSAGAQGTAVGVVGGALRLETPLKN